MAESQETRLLHELEELAAKLAEEGRAEDGDIVHDAFKLLSEQDEREKELKANRDAWLLRAVKAENQIELYKQALQRIKLSAQAGGPGEMPARWFAKVANEVLAPPVEAATNG
jgi:hypothetical protein